MKLFVIRFLLWGLFDVCLTVLSWILFTALIVGPASRTSNFPYDWLIACGLLLAIIIARLGRAARSGYTTKDVAVGWRILAFAVHLTVLATGAYSTCLLMVLLLGAGVSVGEPMG